MIAVDTNILVAAHREDATAHRLAKDAVEQLATGRAAWAIPWPSLHEFLAIVTHARIFRRPTPLALAVDQVEAWLESPALTVLTESSGYWPHLKACLTTGRVSGPMVHDARIAALCLDHGVRQLWTADRDFSRFPQLSCKNPLVG